MEEIVFANCWSHARRKFYDAISTAPVADEIVKMIDELYDIEHEAKDFDDLKKLREEKSSKKVKEIEDWMESKQGSYLKSSNFGKAMAYLYKGLNPFKFKGKIVNSKQKGSFKEFLTNPYIPIDNNMAERAQRDPVMGRKNFYGFRSLDGADVAMTFYSLIGSCKKLGIIPRVYLLEMSLRSLKGEQLLTPFQYGKSLQELSGVE